MKRGVIVSSINFSGAVSTTAIDNNFIDSYMASAPNPAFSLVYIYGLRCASGGLTVSNGDIAKKLNMLESDVVNAWSYWAKTGLIALEKNGGGFSVKFMTPPVHSVNNKIAEDSPKIVAVSPSYAPKDIADIVKHTPEVGEILNTAEAVKGKPISPKETEAIVWMHQNLELPREVIFILLTFCFDRGKPVRYMEKTALDWAEKGISTAEDASNYLSFSTNYAKVLKFFGAGSRSATKREKSFVDKWLTEWEFSLEMVELAASRTLENTGKAAFAYCDKILEKWHALSFTTVEEVERNDEDYKSTKTKNEKQKLQPPKGVFNNYSQNIYTEEEISDILKRKGSIL